ncbi:MAG: hypothetical protein WDN00_17605 [Limisphaerales bacterium]
MSKGCPQNRWTVNSGLTGRNSSETVSIVRRQDKNDLWNEVRFLVFDAPAATGGFEDRLTFLKDALAKGAAKFARQHPHERCKSLDALRAELTRVETLGGEGLMLRQPGSKYVAGRSGTLLKVKTFHDAEAVVVAHQAGAGRHKVDWARCWCDCRTALISPSAPVLATGNVKTRLPSAQR